MSAKARIVLQRTKDRPPLRACSSNVPKRLAGAVSPASLTKLEMLTWICTILINREAETKKFYQTAKYEVLTPPSSKVMSKK